MILSARTIRAALGRPLFIVDRRFMTLASIYALASAVALNPLTARAVVSRPDLERLDLPRLLLGYDFAVALGALGLILMGHMVPWRMTPAALTVGILGWGVLAEGCLRVILFNPALQIPALESPGLYADSEADDDYWVLYHYYSKAAFRTPTGPVDPLLGWVQSNGGPLGVRSERYFEPADVRGRPLLFFGDSFVAGDDDVTSRLPEQLERLLPGTSILNYGVGGYGTDQIALRVKHEGARFRERGAVVVIGILLADMDRSLLRFRISQKPYYSLGQDGLLLHTPAYASNSAFLSAYQFRIHFFALAAMRRVVHRALLRSDGDAVRRAKLNRAILDDLTASLNRERLPAVFVLLYSKPDLEADLRGRPTDREKELKAILDGRKVKAIDTAPFVLEGIQAEGLGLDDVFLVDGHYNARGNNIIARRLATTLRPVLDGVPSAPAGTAP
jgi:hypothetical protein